MLRPNPFLVAICGSLLIIVAGLVHALKQHPPYAPQVNTEQQAHTALKGEENAKAGSQYSAKANEQHGGKHAEKSEEDGTEFWPTYFGLRLKITDSLLAIFTGGLLIFTCLLWRSTDKLWTAGERQLAHLSEASERQLRAYIFLEMIDSIPQYHKLIARVVQMKWRNTGLTPALVIECFCQHHGIAGDDQSPVVFESPVPDVGQQPRQPIGPGGTFLGPPMGYPIDHIVGLHEDRHRSFIRAIIKYSDVLKPTFIRTTEVCFEIKILSDPMSTSPGTKVLGFEAHGNNFFD